MQRSFRSSKLKLSPIFFLAVTGLVCTSPAFTAAQNSQCPEYSQRTVDPRPGRGGNNTPACLQASGPPCANLSYALSEVDNCLKVLVTSDVVLTAPVHISDVQGLVLAAEPGETITVSCEPGALLREGQQHRSGGDGVRELLRAPSVGHPGACTEHPLPKRDERSVFREVRQCQPRQLQLYLQ